ncbi:MAG: hypothetical protein MI723_10755 [Caulobacterales bacterium]|nr:hypothetical protein [Caulobacterales bacterium]
MSTAANTYLSDARRAAQDAQAVQADEKEAVVATACRQVFLAITFGITWGAIAPIVWNATSPSAAIAMLTPALIAAMLWGR